MLFNSWVFLLFLGVVFLLHYAPVPRVARGAWQIGLLTAASLVFYGYHIPWLVGLLAVSLLLIGWASHRLLDPASPAGVRRTILVAGVGANLAALAFFKYAALIAGTVLPEPLAARVVPALASIPLPVGISFYTFQGLSLVIDAWRRRTEGLEGLIERIDRGPSFHARIWFFISFFPQLVAGPIVKAHDFVNQIGPKTGRDIDWAGAVRCLITGYFLKMVCADNLKEATALIDTPPFDHLSSLTLLALLYGFSFQIFADFAGYSLIAIGLGRLFGYRFQANFLFPYLSGSLTEFWQRWHISLSTWLRDYLYIPLGGNRHGHARTYLNLFLVMFLGGLWHGAAWSYAVWGTAHGIGLAIERALRGRGGAGARPLRGPARWAGTFLTFNVVSLLWLLFKLPDFGDVLDYLRVLGRLTGGIPPQTAYLLALFSAPVILYHLWGASGPLRDRIRHRFGPGPVRLVEGLLLALLFFLIVSNSGSPGAFIYFQF